MADYAEFYRARDIVTDILEKDLVGPVLEEECLAELPTQYYIMGKLYPQNDSEEALDLARNPYLENEIESYDASISLSNQRNPASMGITCTLKPGIQSIHISGSYAFYEPVPFEDAVGQGIEAERWDTSENKPKEFWKRKRVDYSEIVSFGGEKVLPPVELSGGLQLQVYTHKLFADGKRVVTVALVNINQSARNLESTARACAFQPVIRIQGEEERGIFTSVSRQEKVSVDPELLELEMLYSDVVCYGQGHGCSVVWDMEHDEPAWISSTWFPSYNLRQMMAAQMTNAKVLSMKFLAEGEAHEIISELNGFLDEYEIWIDKLEQDAKSLSSRFEESAKSNINKCRDAYNRMRHSVDLLGQSHGTDGKAFKAFRHANEAMLLQRTKTYIKNKKEPEIDKITWYPFQLAFILHELSSFIEPKGEARKKADLLWFPTGGGKTEAYLGIAAYVIFLRRLHNPSDDGVTVIMRYTLRLLTLQQFERASMLIFACELLRQKYHLGGKEISIGLWVGDKLTPNDLSEARASITKQQRGAVTAPDEANPCQIQVCPWCGKPIYPKDYSVRVHDNRMIIRCGNTLCDFHDAEDGLPVHIIDQDIYEHLPDFIIATVDKFAQLPLSDKPASLFGISNGKNPPELIIQDELHLLSGPLGTMTGIYEAAITKLCEKDGVCAKVIASTATIRNAGNQIKALYGRDYTQFPPQGISARDSWFAVESTINDRPARKYYGVMGIGTTATTTLIRVNAALLFATRYLAGLGYEDRIIDNFWTITGYFNSLRELGGASTQMHDDVQSRFCYLANTKFAALEPKVDSSEKYNLTEELTSRMDNSELTKMMQVRLKREYHKGQHRGVLDYILSSNMISVGIDVSRLGAMVVVGQPKTNAEYIQATSRVGRDNPGLVITVYNTARSRDRSHYEQFLKYHSALYRYVEATSLTPFADRARDRGLHALYVTLCRYLVPGLLENDRAVNYRADNPKVREIKDMILNYVDIVDPAETEAVMNELEEIEEAWEFAATGTLVYRSFKNDKKLLKGDMEDSRFRTMNSMRNVDAQAGIYLLGR